MINTKHSEWKSRNEAVTLSRSLFYHIDIDYTIHTTRSLARTVPGTRSHHCFKFGVDGSNESIMEMAEFSCFCSSCRERVDASQCKNASMRGNVLPIHLVPEAQSERRWRKRIRASRVTDPTTTQVTADFEDTEDGDMSDEEDMNIASTIQAARRLRNRGTVVSVNDVACHFIVEKSKEDCSDRDLDHYSYYLVRCIRELHLLGKNEVDYYKNHFRKSEEVIQGAYYELVPGVTSADGVYTYSGDVKFAYFRPGCVRRALISLNISEHTTHGRVYCMSREDHDMCLSSINESMLDE